MPEATVRAVGLGLASLERCALKAVFLGCVPGQGLLSLVFARNLSISLLTNINLSSGFCQKGLLEKRPQFLKSVVVGVIGEGG